MKYTGFSCVWRPCRGLLVPALVLMAGCSGYSVTGGPGSTVSPRMQRSVADSEGLRMLSQLYVAPIQSSAAVELTAGDLEVFSKALNSEVGSKVLLHAVSKKPEAPFDSSIGFLRLRIIDARERKGGAWGADEPARVSLLVEVSRAADQRVLWSSSYREAEEPLSDNLFRIKSSRKFHTMSELFLQGVQEVLADFEAARRQAFK